MFYFSTTLIAISALVDGSVARITVKPADITVCVGMDVTIPWEYDHEDELLRATWIKDNEAIMIKRMDGQILMSPSVNNIHYMDNGKLYVSAVTQADSGLYSFDIVYRLDTSNEPRDYDQVHVTVNDPPSLPVYTADVSGAQTIYKCNTSSLGTPKARVTIKIGETDTYSTSASVDFEDPIYCCVVGKAVECIKNNNQQNTYCTNIITPTGPNRLQLSPNTTIYTRNIGETLGPVICSAKCVPDCTYKWLKEFSVVSENASLYFRTITKKDRGNYSCVATRGVRSIATKTVILHVRYGPEDISFHPGGPTYTGSENEQLSIKCLSVCYPACIYTWTDERNSRILSTTDTLYFSSLKREKQGRYKCTVTNEIDGVANPISGTFTVNVRFGPHTVSFDPAGSPYIGNETETLRITCISSCYPGCSYTWKKDGALVSSIGGVLNFSNLNRTHAGTYTCTAKNSYIGISNSQTESVDVKVNYGPDSALLSPPITEYTVNARTKLDDIKCTSECYPICSHTWIKHDTPWVVVAENGMLQLGILEQEDAGKYLCTASNPELSMSKTAQVKMYIRYGPDKVSITPAGQTYSTEEGYTLPDFNCSSECYPGCSQTWGCDTVNVDLASGNVLTLGTANRTFTGNYKCTSTNEADEFRKSLVQSVFISVKYHPDVTVSQVNGTNITEGSQNIILICSAEGNPKTYNFTEWIHYAPDGSTQIRKLEPLFFDHDKAYLKFPNTSYMDSGTYKCSVTNGIPNFTTKDMFTQAEATQVVKGRPVITEWKKNVALGIHDTSSLLVTYYSNDGSIPIVTWYRTENDTIQKRHANEEKIYFENSEATVFVEFYTRKVLLSGYKTELFIQNITQSDFGDYNVSVSNSVGTTFLTIHLNALVKEPSATSNLNVAAAAGGVFAGVFIVVTVAVLCLLHRYNRLPGTRKKQQSDAAMSYTNGYEYVNMAASSSGTVCKAALERKPDDSRLTDKSYESLNTERKSSSTYKQLTTEKQSDTKRSTASEYDVLDSETTNKHMCTGIEDLGQKVAEPEAVYSNLMIRDA